MYWHHMVSMTRATVFKTELHVTCEYSARGQENSRRSNFKSLRCGQQSQSSKKRHYFSVKLFVLHKLPKLLESDLICWPDWTAEGRWPGVPHLASRSSFGCSMLANVLVRRVEWLESCEADEPPLTLPNNVILLVEFGLKMNTQDVGLSRHGR